MFEARLLDGAIFKQIIEAIRDLVTDANMDVSEEDLVIQCMDSSHVSLVDVQLQVGAFDHYRCDKPLSLGINPPNLAKVLKMMNKDDIVVLKADDDGDTLTMMFESDKDNRTIADFGKSVPRTLPRSKRDCCCLAVMFGRLTQRFFGVSFVGCCRDQVE